MFVPYRKTELDVEEHFAVNYLGHFLLTLLSLDLLRLHPGSAIINVTSSLYRLGNRNIISDALKATPRYK